jgi:hypothetical protein
MADKIDYDEPGSARRLVSDAGIEISDEKIDFRIKDIERVNTLEVLQTLIYHGEEIDLGGGKIIIPYYFEGENIAGGKIPIYSTFAGITDRQKMMMAGKYLGSLINIKSTTDLKIRIKTANEQWVKDINITGGTNKVVIEDLNFDSLLTFNIHDDLITEIVSSGSGTVFQDDFGDGHWEDKWTVVNQQGRPDIVLNETEGKLHFSVETTIDSFKVITPIENQQPFLFGPEDLPVSYQVDISGDISEDTYTAKYNEVWTIFVPGLGQPPQKILTYGIVKEKTTGEYRLIVNEFEQIFYNEPCSQSETIKVKYDGEKIEFYRGESNIFSLDYSLPVGMKIGFVQCAGVGRALFSETTRLQTAIDNVVMNAKGGEVSFTGQVINFVEHNIAGY